MDDNTSVSKGVFVYKEGYKVGKEKREPRSPSYSDDVWYAAYKEIWSSVKNATTMISTMSVDNMITKTMSFVSKAKSNELDMFDHEIPTAILLTGINVPDHTVLFQTLSENLKEITNHVVVIWSADCGKSVNLLEEIVHRLLNTVEQAPEVRKSHCSMRTLKTYFKKFCNPDIPLVIILPDFESFPTNVLKDIILILSIHTKDLKFVLIFGVATTLHVVHKTLSYDVTSKLIIEVFETEKQITTLSRMLDETIFSPKIPFKLTGKAFRLLTDIFLFYDFSVDRFLQNFKICMIQHFFKNNMNGLCCDPMLIPERLAKLSDNDINKIKKLPSIIEYFHIVLPKEKNPEQMNKTEFMNSLEEILAQFHDYMNRFFIFLKCLHTLFSSLPNPPLGKQLREIYAKAVSTSNITKTQEYKESLQLLNFLSKDEFLEKLQSVVSNLETSSDDIIQKFRTILLKKIEVVQKASLDVSNTPKKLLDTNEKLSRIQFKEKLLKLSKEQTRSPYKQAQADTIDYLSAVFSEHLTSLNEITGHEIFCYDDISSSKQHIRGSLRGTVHTALTDPHVYFECECCKLEDENAIPRTLPDLSIVYKLHLESRKLINIYDWLQAFKTIVDPNDDSEEVKPEIQARFTRAVAELQFLGFIKTSRRKTDHVKRLI